MTIVGVLRLLTGQNLLISRWLMIFQLQFPQSMNNNEWEVFRAELFRQRHFRKLCRRR